MVKQLNLNRPSLQRQSLPLGAQNHLVQPIIQIPEYHKVSDSIYHSIFDRATAAFQHDEDVKPKTATEYILRRFE
jgi:hypothetical protein